jgi:hypothetical protein
MTGDRPGTAAPEIDIFTDDLQAALAARGCPVCRVVADAERRWLDSFWREGKNGRAAREAFLGAGGFCAGHGLLLETLAQGERGAAAIADVYGMLAARDIERLAAARDHVGRRRRRPVRRRRHCPACEQTAAATDRKLWFLIDALHAGATRERYARSDGLCMPHLLDAAGQSASEPEVCRFLLDDACRRLGDLCAQLNELQRKRDHRFRHEPKAAEQLAPGEAIRRYGGGSA